MMMKRHASLELAALSLTMLSACSASNESASAEAEPSFVPSEASTAPTTVTETVEKTQDSTEEKGAENGAEHGDADTDDDTPPSWKSHALRWENWRRLRIYQPGRHHPRRRTYIL